MTPPLSRRTADEVSEHIGEVRVSSKAAEACNSRYRYLRLKQKPFRVIDTPADQVLMRPQSGGDTKSSREVHSTESRRKGKFPQLDRTGQIGINVGGDSL
jgi:hypothetical protein